MTINTPQSNPTPIRALLDTIETIPVELYGTGRSRFLRRLVHVVLAKHADADGSSIFASLGRISYLSLASERSVQTAIDHLESANLVRKLDDQHPVYGTTQYELVWPTEEALKLATETREQSLRNKREQTRRRVSEWRAKQGRDRVTEVPVVTQTSVTEVPSVTVTEDQKVCNGRLELGNGSSAIGNGRSEGVVTEEAASVDRPLPSSNTVRVPSFLPSQTSEGRSDEFSHSKSRTSDKVLGVLGDCLKEKSGKRSTPDKPQESVFRTELETNGVRDVVLAFVMFLDRPKGVTTLNDPWGRFLKDLPEYLRDVDAMSKEYSDEDALEELWFDLFQFSTPERDRLRESVDGLINDGQGRATEPLLPVQSPALEVAGGVL